MGRFNDQRPSFRQIFQFKISFHHGPGLNKWAHQHSHIALRIHQHCKRHFGHFARTVPRGLGRGEGYGDTVVTFLERAENATLDVAAEILGLSAPSLPHNTRSEMSLPIRFGGMGVGDLVALADAAHVGAAGLAVSSTIRFLIAQNARVRSRDTHDEVPMEPTMHGRLATTMTTAVSRMRGTPDGDNEPMWSLELASSWALGCRVRFSRSHRVRTPHIHNLSDSPPATSSGGSSRLHSRSPIKQRASYSVS
jgi:hypothetical protein